MVRPLAVVLLALLVSAAPAAAAPPWSAVQDLSAPHTFVDGPTVGVFGNGTTLATWGWRDDIGQGSASEIEGAEWRPGAAGFAAPHPVSAAPQLFYRTTRALAAIAQPLGADPADQRMRVAAVFGRADGTFGSPRTIAVRPNVRQVLLAGNAAGDAAIAWWEDRGVRTDRAYVSLRRRGGSFGVPIRVVQERIRSISVAVSPRGEVLVAWDARGVAHVRARVHGRWGRVDAIRSRPAYNADLRTAIAANGRAFVAWGAQLSSEGGCCEPLYYQAAVRPVGAARFRAAQLLERQRAGHTLDGLDLLLDARNRATVAWTGWDGTHHRVRATDTGRGATFGVAQDVSPAGEDAFEDVLATAPDGRRLVAWTVPRPTFERETGGRILAAFAPSSGPFGAPEEVTSGIEARAPAAAYDATANRWTLVWSNRPAGSGNPIPLPPGQIRTLAQTASRTAG